MINQENIILSMKENNCQLQASIKAILIKNHKHTKTHNTELTSVAHAIWTTERYTQGEHQVVATPQQLLYRSVGGSLLQQHSRQERIRLLETTCVNT